MYPEFITIYIGLGIVIILLIVAIILLLLLMKKLNNYPIQLQEKASSAKNAVFCRKCATKFDSSQHVCPNCGTPR